MSLKGKSAKTCIAIAVILALAFTFIGVQASNVGDRDNTIITIGQQQSVLTIGMNTESDGQSITKIGSNSKR